MNDSQTDLLRRKPPYQQGYEDGMADMLDGELEGVGRTIFDHEDYSWDEGSKDRMFYEEGYDDGYHNKRNKLED